MESRTDTRGKYWWVWPDFNEEKDARDAAKMGVFACGLIAAITGFIFWYRYFKTDDINQLFGGIAVIILFSLLGYGTIKMSMIAASLAFILFVTEKLYGYFFEGRQLGIAMLLALYLLHAVRGIYWFKQKMKKQH